MFVKLLHMLIGYNVIIECEKGVSKNDKIITRCWLSKDCSVRAMWCGTQVILNSDHSVSGLPKSWCASWRVK